MMQRPSNGGLLTASPTSIRNVAPRGLGVRPTLPERNVTGATIEDAYVRFIFYCNPAVPLDTDTTTLREAFRTPPKSGGKSFSTFTLFELIKQLAEKEIKTWAELALKLGVEPPDQDKGQSSQKIQQYAVRLKRWMHSMHVDAFFEYLLNNSHPYWTQIPSDPNPVSDILRDGVAAEDDMALRALLPQIRPRRGRRKPEDDDLNKSPSQRPRLESPMNEEFPNMRPDTLDPWTAHPDARNAFIFPQTDGRLSLGTGIAHQSGPPWTNDIAQTPLTAYPQSAITPSTRQGFWENEPKSAITLSKPRSMNRRHGAKVVSSAWRSSGLGGTGKTRGRPPINRNANDGPFSAFPTDNSLSFTSAPSEPPHMSTNVAPTANMTPTTIMPPAPPPPTMLNRSESTPTSAGPRPVKPARLSLQVPERAGGEVRLATPPPVVMVNGQATPTNGDVPMPQPTASSLDLPYMDLLNGRNLEPSRETPLNGPFVESHVHFEDPSDRTNIDDLESFFLHEITTANWVDAGGNSIPSCSIEEAQGIVATVIENLLNAATTKEAFLINLAALAGGRLLMTTTSLRITRLEEHADHTKFVCNWELRFGDIKGQFSMKETVMHDKWKKADKDDDSATLGGEEGGAGEQSAAHWQKKYQELVDVVMKKDAQLFSIKSKVIQGLKEPQRERLDP